ncbi:MAG: hypothetical protein J6Y01_00525 [Spirochaetales bacterium]|nr:hypothetical protein [Spirochaetales bacterium]
MIKKMLTFTIIMTVILSLFGCAKKDKNKEPKTPEPQDVKIESILPQTAYLAAVRRQLKGVDWNKYIFTGSFDYDKSKESTQIWAYEMGVLLTNCGFASAIKDEEGVKKLSDEILDHAQKADIVDEDVVMKIMDIIHSFEALIKDENYREISNKVKEIESVIRKYYKDKQDDAIIMTVKFSCWLEAFYIVSRAVTDNYNDTLLNLFNRSQEVAYFQKAFAKKSKMGETELLNSLAKEMEHKDAMTEATVKKILADITEFRTQYVK